MGVDDRPSRSSKVKALQQLQQQSGEEELEPDADAEEVQFARAPRRKRVRSSRRPAIGSSDDNEDDADELSPVPDLNHEGTQNDTMHFDAQPPADINMNAGNDDGESEDPDANDEVPLQDAYLAPAPIHPAAGTVVTKSGRLSKRPLPLSPSISPVVRSRRTSMASLDIPLTREQRMERRRRMNETRDELRYSQERDVPRSLRRAGRRGSYHIDAELDENDDDEEDYLEKDDGDMSTPRPDVSRVTRSRAVKVEDHEPRNGHRRVSTRRRGSAGAGEAGKHPYGGKEAPLGTANGVRRSRRNERASGKYRLSVRHSDGEVEGDGDFPSPGTGEDSDDLERGFEVQEEVLDGEQQARDDSDHDFQSLRRSQRQRARSKRGRKTQPQRSVPAKRRVPQKRRKERPESSMARETRKSYRPRREPMRAADFYPEIESSEDSFSSDDVAPAAKRLRPTRAAASRAGDAIANKLTPLDYLGNPMATMDAGVSLRPPRSGRYDRRRSRLRPTGTDPFASDGDDPLGAPSNVVNIEPIQVDFDLSWDDVGGLDHHVRALKEMVSLPLLYPEVFEKFHMEAPKGVLFYGPPGTGKTLCARALAASCGAEPEPEDGPASQPTEKDGKKNADSKRPGVSTAADANDPGNMKSGVRDPGSLDVKMTEADSQPKGAIGEDGLPIPVSADGDEVAAPDGTVGPHTLATEHETVITERGNEVQTRLQKLSSGSGAAELNAKTTAKQDLPTSKPKARKKPRVSFFMRNGADCLSKWVGEAERQLRMTFDAARKHQPSIIFFDEIDGLAPVRSSRQDQIHSSIVSTLLGLMDGLDSRGKVVVIGATNRVDAIDPALRRPGRFDRELIFTLPNIGARRKILGIHTSKWSPPPAPAVLDAVAKMTVGYCGADLKSLCSEAAIRALRRRYPQIYESRDKLLIDVDQVRVITHDFLAAMKEIVPSSHRSARTHARPISERLTAVLNGPLRTCLSVLRKIFPQGLDQATGTKHSNQERANRKEGELKDANGVQSMPEMKSDSEGEEDEAISFEGAQARIAHAGRFRPVLGGSGLGKHQTLRPRLLICGMQGLGQAQLGPALLHTCEGCPVHAIDFPSLHADAGARSVEEALISAFREALRSVPSILYLPHLQLWWESAPQSLRTTLIIAMKDLPADLPLLVLATAETPLNDLPADLTELFGETLELSAPSEESRKEMFAPLLQEAQAVPMMSNAAARHLRQKRKTEVLPKAPPPPPKEPTVSEWSQKVQSEDRFIRRLRMEMRAFVENLLRDRRFKAFWHPVDPKSAPDYYDIIKVPMDISKIAAQIDLGKYPTILAMVNDFDTMVRNAIQYNPPNTEMGAAILRRAHGLIDIVHAWVDNLNPSIVEACNKIIAGRIARSQKEMNAKETALEEAGKSTNKENESTDAQPVGAPNTMELGGGNTGNGQASAELPEASPQKSDRPSCAAEVNGRAEDAARIMGSQLGGKVGLLSQPTASPEEFEEEPAIAAKRSDVSVLRTLLLAVSTGLTVDGLEGLYVRCAKVLHEKRRCMNRAEVVGLLTDTVNAARDDPAVVGKLVA